MKHTFRYILSAIVMLVPVLALAQDPPIYSNYKKENGVCTAKSVTSVGNNLYTLTLETFATGEKTIIKTYTPVEVVLILDTSYSMIQYNYTYYDEDQGRNVTTTRLNALKYAVKKFVDEIARNDGYDDNGNRRKDEAGNEIVLGNRIQIVTFDASARARFNAFQPAFANSESIKTTIDGFTQGYGTHTHEGMDIGLTWVTNSKNQRPNSNRVVVMFTDGCPANSGNTDFRADYAGQAVNTAKEIKDLGATVYAIGLIDWDVLRRANADYPGYVADMMEYISSNYPDGTATWQYSTRPQRNTLSCSSEGGRVDDKYQFYVDANETDLGEIFKSIGQASGGSENSVPGETQLVDEVSSSFEVPSTFTAEDVVVYTRSINADGDAWGTASELTVVDLSNDSSFDPTKLPPANAEYMTSESKVGVYLKDGLLRIVGFNYSKEDSEGTNGTTVPFDGNWVGWRPLGDDAEDGQICAGKELVIQFNIEAIDDVTGGDNTNTNTTASGVYIPVYDDNGVFQGYAPATKYPYPDTDLPINLVIQKKGLRKGESATIQIYRAPQKVGEYNEYTGKPAPDLTDGWENFSKVILTNKGEDFKTVEKTLLSLDPSYVYRLEEDNWGFGYILDTYVVDTSEQVANPFIFTNTLKVTPEDWADEDGVPRTPVKHAEAVSINHFGSGAHAETLKGTKGFN